MRTLSGLVSLAVLAILPSAAPAAPQQVIELRAAELTVRGAGDVIDARGHVRITDGRSTVRAGRAVYRVRERRIELSAEVAIVSADGNLRAERALILLSAGRRITEVQAAGDVTLQVGSRTLAAARVDYTIGGPNATASGNVRLHLPPDIVASGQQLALRGDVGTLSGGAKVETNDGWIEGDTIEVSEREQIAVVRGHVRARFADTQITSDAATLSGRERKAVFRDNVTVVRPGRTMKAALVTVFYDEKRIVAEGETNIRIDEEQQRP